MILKILLKPIETPQLIVMFYRLGNLNDPQFLPSFKRLIKLGYIPIL